MLTQKLLAAAGLAGALLLTAATDASANPFRGPRFVPTAVYRAPVYRAPVFVPAPRVAVYPAPVYGPVYSAPVYAPAYSAPVYGPVYRPVGWGYRHHWVRPYGHRW
jgi:hypothetical protein